MKEAGGQMTLNYEDCHNLYSLPNVITMMKSGKMKWEGHRACMTAWTWTMDNIQINIKYRVSV